MSLSLKRLKEEYSLQAEKINPEVIKWLISNKKELTKKFKELHPRSPFELNVEVKRTDVGYYCISFMEDDFDVKRTHSVAAILDWRYLTSQGCPK